MRALRASPLHKSCQARSGSMRILVGMFLSRWMVADSHYLDVLDPKSTFTIEIFRPHSL